MREHGLEMGDLITLPASSGLTFNRSVAPLLALPMKASPIKSEVAALHPEPDLIKRLSDKRRSKPLGNDLAADYEVMIEFTARQHQVSPLLVKAVIQAESNFDPRAVSHRGAVGLIQVMPATARAMGVQNLTDPQKNITAGVKYLKVLLKLFNDDEKLAIAAYNCGPEVMKRFKNQVPPFRETRAFVDRVMSYYNSRLEG
jgi:soluble lytic murein transglycosylase-like protein